LQSFTFLHARDDTGNAWRVAGKASAISCCTHIGYSDIVADVRVIARSTLREFVESLKGTKACAPVKSALDAWFQEVRSAAWRSPAELKRAYVSASIVGDDRVVFNIKGNDYRLVTVIDYTRQVVFIKWIGNHAEYDRIDVAAVKYAGKTNQK
jgi:mRNA interferase HigB